jgi:hypothetical protein
MFFFHSSPNCAHRAWSRTDHQRAVGRLAPAVAVDHVAVEVEQRLARAGARPFFAIGRVTTTPGRRSIARDARRGESADLGLNVGSGRWRGAATLSGEPPTIGSCW